MCKSASAPRVKQPPETPLGIPRALCSHTAPSSAHNCSARPEGHHGPQIPSGMVGAAPLALGHKLLLSQPREAHSGNALLWKTWTIHFGTKIKSLFLNWSSQFLQEGNLGLAPWTEMSEGLCRCWVMPKEHGTDREPDPSVFPCSGSSRPAGRAGPWSPRAAPAVAVTQPWFLCPNTGN